jgi:hypothetical protein
MSNKLELKLEDSLRGAIRLKPYSPRIGETEANLDRGRAGGIMPPMPPIASVSAYRKSKSTDPTTRGFGLKLGGPLRDRWVTPGAQVVWLELECLSSALEVCLLDGFWSGCPEFMHAAVHGWIVGQGLPVPWPPGKPHRFEMERVSGTHFG